MRLVRSHLPPDTGKANSVTLLCEGPNSKGTPMTTAAPANKILTPAAPPRILESVYSDDEFARMMAVVKRDGPWGTIISHHFQTVDEVIATVSGVIPPDHGLTLDYIAGPPFRGI